MYPYQYNNMSQPFNNVTKVAGIDAVRNFQMPPNSMGAFFCETDDILYFKTTDGTGFPTIRGFYLKEFPIGQSYVTRDELPKDYVTHDELPKDYVTREELSALSDKIDGLMEALNG